VKAQVDAARCQGHGRCYDWYPDLFREGPDGHATAIPDQLDENALGDVESAIGMCPESAISTTDA
jgi:ferredoxin